MLFWRTEFGREQVLAQWSYQARGKIPTTFPKLTNEMNHINRALTEERAAIPDNRTSNHSLALQFFQKGITQMSDVIQNFTLVGHTVNTHLQGDFSIPRACRLQFSHYVLLGAILTHSGSKKHYLMFWSCLEN